MKTGSALLGLGIVSAVCLLCLASFSRADIELAGEDDNSSVHSNLPPSDRAIRPLTPSHDNAERDYHPDYEHNATGDHPGSQKYRRKNYKWPVPLLTIGNTMASYQNYDGNAYFHHGLDIRANAGAEVRASVGGTVISVKNYMAGDLYWEVAIKDNDGYIWQYHHLDPRSIPASIKEALRTHSPIESGVLLGKVIRWSQNNFGQLYNHLHLNIIGSGGNYLNPFEFLKPLKDKIAPKINRIALLKNGRAVEATTVQGNYGLCVDVGDKILGSTYTVPPNKIEYSIDGEEKRIVWEFRRLPGGPSKTKFVNKFFVPSGTQGSYDRQKFLINLGFSTKGNIKFPSTPGKHKVEVFIEDFEGNKTSKKFEWVVG